MRIILLLVMLLLSPVAGAEWRQLAEIDDGLGINALTSAEPGWPNGGAVFHDTAVWIKRATD